MDYGSDSIVLARPRKTSDLFELLLFHRYDEVSLREKLLLAYKATVVGKATVLCQPTGRSSMGKNSIL